MIYGIKGMGRIKKMKVKMSYNIYMRFQDYSNKINHDNPLIQ
jgi:hypothetical protein